MNARAMSQVAAVVAVVVLAGFFVLTVGCGKNDTAGTGEVTMKAKCVNTMCPMTGMKIDPMTVPDAQIRDFNGMKIGFCSAECPKEWDKLTDADKQMKLDKIMPKKEM